MIGLGKSRTRSRRALSTVVGTVIFIMILTTLLSGFIVYLAQRQMLGREILMSAMSRDIKILSANSISGDNDFNVCVWNRGGEKARLVAIWFLNETNHFRFSLNSTENHTYIDPGWVVYLNGSDINSNEQIQGINYSTFDHCQVVEERGDIDSVSMGHASSLTITAFGVLLYGPPIANGFVWLDSPVEKTYTTTSAWTDLDASGDVPSEAIGIVVAMVADTTSDYHGVVRGKEDTNNYMSSTSYCEFEDETWRFQIVKLDSNRKFQYWSQNTAIKFYILGYTLGNDPKYRTVPTSISPIGTGWQTYTAPDVDADTDGIILFIQTLQSDDTDVEVRAVGSSNTQSSREWEEYNIGLWVVKIDANDQFQIDLESTNAKIYLIAETKGSIEYYTNYVSITDPSTGSWQDIDLDNYVTVPDDASGVIVRAVDTSTTTDYRAGVRKNGITWAPPNNRFDCGADQQVILASGIDDGNIFEAYYESTSIGMYIEAVTRYYTV